MYSKEGEKGRNLTFLTFENPSILSYLCDIETVSIQKA